MQAEINNSRINSGATVYFVGVDVGTGSARAALVTSSGCVVKTAVEPIQIWSPKVDYYEQSSENIWSACVHVIKAVTENCNPQLVKGIGFDATCSLVGLDKNGAPLTVSPTGNNNQNVILWMDHRASKEADYINAFQHSVLRYVGGKLSLEMETPKLLWLKNNLKSVWSSYGFFFDLPDFLTWKATGSETRSLCSLVCKWNYEIHPDSGEGWNKGYFNEIGLGDLLENDCQKIGKTVLMPGSPCGTGLTAEIAVELGLLPGTPVGTSIIDAHAGGLGMIGCSAPGISSTFHSRLSLICGTSTCHMAVNPDPTFAPGIWGPYFSAMVPDMWLNEGGQSATGKLIDHIIDSHPARKEIQSKLSNGIHIQTYLSNLLKDLTQRSKLTNMAYLTRNVHVWPDFHGNRSPLADPSLRGMISGLTLSTSEDDLAILYLATIQALAYGTKHILETLLNSGYKEIQSILICGGLSKNPIFIQTQADIVGMPVLCPKEAESVLLGAAILGACAAKHFATVTDAIKAMGGEASIVRPNDELAQYHAKKYKVFLKMVQNQKTYREIMANT